MLDIDVNNKHHIYLCVCHKQSPGIDGTRQIILFATMTEMYVYRTLGRVIAKRRKELALTQAEVAKHIGLTRASLANIETGRQKVLLHQVYRLVDALKLRSILDLVPPTSAFDEQPPKPLSFGGSDVAPNEQAQLEKLIQLALSNVRTTGQS